MYRRFFKRALDIVFSLFAIIVLSPVITFIAVLVRIKMGRPILFAQERIGKDEHIFNLYKFRSMTNEKDENGHLLDESVRLTKFGMILRSTSLDELPELFMILTGNMSFVGPRPQPKYYGPYYSENERIAHSVRGGLLPPDSLCKEPQCSWETQLEYETYYAEHVSLCLDLRIILCTFIILLKRVRTNYGADDRPKLNEYRSDWNVSQDEIDSWASKKAGRE